MKHDLDTTLPRSLDEIRAMAIHVADRLQAATGTTPINGGGGWPLRGLPENLRMQFLAVRTALFQRGFFDPVLVRFDTATGTQASTAEIAQQLKAVAATL